jgi:hypothetical protein
LLQAASLETSGYTLVYLHGMVLMLIYYFYILPNNVVEQSSLHIWKVPILIFAPEAGYPETFHAFPQYLQKSAGLTMT